METISIIVTGANGQLGKTLRDLSDALPRVNFIWTDINELDITNYFDVNKLFETINPDYCINCAAYTAVDNAEKKTEKAFLINAKAVKNLALACKEFQTKLIHISTDFVFDGKSKKPYTEEDQTIPLSVYGNSKLAGEKEILDLHDKFFIIRTSWLYSEYGHNFVKTMLKLAETKPKLSVVSDQIGTPTYAKNLAEVIFKIISSKNSSYGIYHYSNSGQTTWFDFAQEIFKMTNKNVIVRPVCSLEYSTLAVRPRYSVLSKDKIIQAFNLTIPEWKESLKEAIKQLNERKS